MAINRIDMKHLNQDISFWQLSDFESQERPFLTKAIAYV